MTQKPAARAQHQSPLEEDTDLPPPLPGLQSTVEHVFDPPTLPGVVAPHRSEHDSLPPVPIPQATHDAPLHLRSTLALQTLVPLTAAVPQPQFHGHVDYTLRMPTMIQLEPSAAPESLAMLPSEPSALTLPPPPETLRQPPAATRLGKSLEGDTTQRTGHRSTHTLPSLELGQLPALPMLPEQDRWLDRLRYTLTVQRSLRKRHRLEAQLQQEETIELDALDRLLVQIGQRAYAEHIDLLSQHPLLLHAFSAGPLREMMLHPQPESLLRKRAEVAASHLAIAAEQHLSVLAQRQSAETERLLELTKQRRHHRAELWKCEQRARSLPRHLPLWHPSHVQTVEAARAAAAIEEQLAIAAQQLASTRAEQSVYSHLYKLGQSPPELLLPVLSHELALQQKRPPHLRILGAAVAATWTYGEASLGTGYGFSLEPVLTNLTTRYTLLARLLADRHGYDREAVRRTYVTASVMLLALVLSVGIAAWAMLGG